MMLSEVMEFYGIERDFQASGFFETEQLRQLMKAIRPTRLSGKLVAVTGLVGSGKTRFLHRFEAALKEEGRFTVARSLSVDKERTTLTTLITVLFYDLSSEKIPRIPTQGEELERALRELVRRGRLLAAPGAACRLIHRRSGNHCLQPGRRCPALAAAARSVRQGVRPPPLQRRHAHAYLARHMLHR
jgi:hypothetical protein